MNVQSIFKQKLIILIHVTKYLVAYVISKILKLNNKYDDIWLISERRNEARDNGYHLYKFIKNKYPDVKIYYAIDKHCPDFDKISPFNSFVEFSSFKHYLFYFLSNKHISTHLEGYLPNYSVCKKMNSIFKVEAKKVFLQHGIIKDYLKSTTKINANLDIFVCGAQPEFKYIMNNFGYKNNEVKYLGLCRFDHLFDFNVKRQILLMPTYRADLFPYSDRVDNNMKDRFRQSNYFKTYQSLINNSELKELLIKSNTKLIFYPHYEVQRFLDLFSSDCENVKIASREDHDIQQLLKESATLITDYSSVYFDFAYMKKPVIYYHFDYEDYRKIQYEEGYFSYKKHGFGPIYVSEKELIEELILKVENNFLNEQKYMKRIKQFFPLNDQNNCQRNFDAIQKLGM